MEDDKEGEIPVDPKRFHQTPWLNSATDEFGQTDEEQQCKQRKQHSDYRGRGSTHHCRRVRYSFVTNLFWLFQKITLTMKLIKFYGNIKKCLYWSCFSSYRTRWTNCHYGGRSKSSDCKILVLPGWGPRPKVDMSRPKWTHKVASCVQNYTVIHGHTRSGHIDFRSGTSTWALCCLFYAL